MIDEQGVQRLHLLGAQSVTRELDPQRRRLTSDLDLDDLDLGGDQLREVLPLVETHTIMSGQSARIPRIISAKISFW